MKITPLTALKLIIPLITVNLLALPFTAGQLRAEHEWWGCCRLNSQGKGVCCVNCFCELSQGDVYCSQQSNNCAGVQ